jgi:peptidase E
MPRHPGIIALMGSGEMTATMVEVHKALLRGLGDAPRAVFLDTPAGFQLNADVIARKAVDYFRDKVGYALVAASFKSAEQADSLDARRSFGLLADADYLLIGPGSPTYALRHLQKSPIPTLLIERIAAGACLVTASAAALTVGRLTLPVYEIYKSGEPLHWVEGLDLLGHFGFNLVVVPHWNNAEGGNHDTRRCFMGVERFSRLERLIEPPMDILGLDEHTALIIDLAGQFAEVKGIGRAVLRRRGQEYVYKKGERIPLAWLRGDAEVLERPADPEQAALPAPGAEALLTGEPVGGNDIWSQLRGLLETIGRHLEGQQPEEATRALLELERTIWSGRAELQAGEALGAAREVLREAIVLFGTHLAARPASRRACLADLVTSLLAWRERLRDQRQWEMADTLRQCLKQTGVIVEDTPQGAHWHITTDQPVKAGEAEMPSPAPDSTG